MLNDKLPGDLDRPGTCSYNEKTQGNYKKRISYLHKQGSEYKLRIKCLSSSMIENNIVFYCKCVMQAQ